MSATVPSSDRQMLGFRTSAETIDGSDDLLTKVLLLLPVRPLFRFKLVSKRWLSLISSPLFASLWRPEQVLPTALILSSYFGEGPFCFPLDDDDSTNFKVSATFLDFLKYDDNSSADKASSSNSKDSPTTYDVFLKHYNPDRADIEIMSSCDGLILCRVGHFKYKVCNLTTKQVTTLPPVSQNALSASEDVTLAFDHSVSLHYKVTNVDTFGLIDVYSSETDSWKPFRARFPEKILKGTRERSKHDWEGVFFKGAIFWTFSQINCFCYFDVDTEVLHADYPMPTMDVKYYCGSVNEHLYLVGSVGSNSLVSEWGGQCNVFELGNDRSSWSLKYRIDLSEVAGHAFHKRLYRCEGEDYKWVYGTTREGHIEFGVHSVIMKREGETEPYLAFYIPCIAKPRRIWRGELGLPIVHHLIENPFWVGSTVSSIDNE